MEKFTSLSKQILLLGSHNHVAVVYLSWHLKNAFTSHICIHKLYIYNYCECLWILHR